MSYTRLLYHIVFRTKYGEPAIVEEHEELTDYGIEYDEQYFKKNL